MISNLTFYSVPWDGPTAGIVQSNGRTYELRSNGYGGYGATELTEEDLEKHGANMLELSQEEVNLNLDKVTEAISRI